MIMIQDIKALKNDPKKKVFENPLTATSVALLEGLITVSLLLG